MAASSREDTIEVRELLAGLDAFVKHEVIPLEDANSDLLNDPRQVFDPDGSYSTKVLELRTQVRRASAEAGYYGLFAPVESGGADADAEVLYETWRHMHRRYGPGRILPFDVVAHWTAGPGPLVGMLTPAMRHVAEALMDGSATACFAMSEPEAGSDSWAMSTRATRVAGGWTITGNKQWISHAPFADYAFVFAVTDDEQRRAKRGGVSCFLVPMKSDGVVIDRVIQMFGSVGGDEVLLSLENVIVGDDNLVGELDRGFAVAMSGVSTGRMYNAGRCVGLAEWALERGIDYALERKTFGRSISEYQGVQFKLAESAMRIYAAGCAARDCARRLRDGENVRKEVDMVKAICTEMAFKVIDEMMQVHGGNGFTNEIRLYDGWHQVRKVMVADGSAEIMRRAVAKRLLSGDRALLPLAEGRRVGESG